MNDEKNQREKLLEIIDIGKSYGRHRVLETVSLTLHRGEVVALLGVNGAGKTTLSSLIAAVHPPSFGDIVYQGVSIYEAILDYRSHIGYCPQKLSESSSALSVYEQLWFAGQFFGMHGDELCERIEHVMKSFGLTEVKHRPLSELSGGYKQRFALARSVLHRPDIVILDEPTVALDPHVRRQLWNYIMQMRADGVAVVLTTHYLDEAEYLADRICVLHHGKVLFIGTSSDWVESLGEKRLEDAFLQMLTEKKDNI